MERQWKCCQPFFPFFPHFLQRRRSALVVTGGRVLPNYLKRRIRFLLIPARISHPFARFLLSSFFCGPSGQTDAVCTWQGKTLIFFFLGVGTVLFESEHHLRRTYSLPLLPRERFSSSPLQEGGEKQETGEDSLEGGERARLVGNQQDA